MENAILDLQLEIDGVSIKCTILTPLLSFIIIVVKKALAELVYWHHMQARPKESGSMSPSLKVFARQARLQTHLSANVRTPIDRDECFTEVV